MNKFFKSNPMFGYYLIILGCVAKLSFIVFALLYAIYQ